MRLAAAEQAAVGGLMRGSAPAPQCKERGLLTILSGPRSSCYSLRSPFGPASGCYSRWSLPCLPKPITHTRPRGIHAPGHSFGVIQTILLALPNFGLERMGREKPQQLERFFAAVGRKNFQFSVFGFCVRSAPKTAFPA